MSYITNVVGKISNLKRIDWKETGAGGQDRVGVEFTVGQPTGRKHPEGHPYAGKSVIEWTRCKSFIDSQAEMILKRFKDGDYIALNGELRVNPYARQNVDVSVPRAGQEPLKLKATVPDYPALEFIIDRVHFVTDAPEGYNSNSTPVIEEGTASELEAIAQQQLAAATASAATNTAANESVAGQSTGELVAAGAGAGAQPAGATKAPF